MWLELSRKSCVGQTFHFPAKSSLSANDPIAVAGSSVQNPIMKMRSILCLLLMPLTATCVGEDVDGGEQCTVEAIGKKTGAGSLEATLQVPMSYMSGAEISDGGISVQHSGCDFPLNAFFSKETAERVIEETPSNTLSHHDGFFRVVDASLSIWKFSDASGETRFFVMGVHKMRPILKARTSHEKRYYDEPGDGS